MADALRDILPAKRSGKRLARKLGQLRKVLTDPPDPGLIEAGNDQQPVPADDAPKGRRRLARGTSSDTERMRDDMRLAREIQLRFLPSIPAEFHGVQMVAEYRPAFDVGGDFYDLIQTDANRFTVVMGDVSGKGVAAALIMTRIMVEFRSIALQGLAPNEILAKVNQCMVDQGFEEGFITAACVEVDLEARTLSVANAGHVPLFVRRANGSTFTFGDASGVPLGLLPGETYRVDTLSFEPNDIVMLVTDGVTEALEPEADPCTGVVAGLVARGAHDVRALSRRILGSVDLWAKERQADDVALFAMQMA